MNPSVSAPDFDRLSPRDRIIHKLDRLGVPKAALEQSQNGLVAFVKKNKSMIPEIVSAIFPSSEEERHSTSPEKGTFHSLIVNLYIESLLWIQWLMFEADPQTTLEDLERIGAGQRAVCGSVWGEKDLAYRCRTCENDSTCAICVTCFQNGDHKDHDYSMMYTGGGCCDCGDVTAWKREGFCSAHKGAEQIQPLPEEIANSMGPVLDALLVFWTGRLSDAGSRGGNEWVVNLICYPVVDMLIKFCNLSESLLSFIAKRMIPLEGVLDVLMRAETFLQKPVAHRLHEFFLKLLGEPVFKYEFAKVFVRYYPHVIDEASQRGGDFADQKFLLLPSFSVQLFTVPTLVVRLVREVDLLNILLGCLRRLFLSRAGEGGVLEIGRFADIYENTVRVVEDIRYVMSHAEVSKHVARDRPEIYRTWMELLSMVQGMGRQKRMTSVHVEEENEHIYIPFVLTHFLGNVSSLLLSGSFSVDDADEGKDDSFCCTSDGDGLRHAKVGRLSLESSVSSVAGKNKESFGQLQCIAEGYLSVSSAVPLLLLECLKAIEKCSGFDIENEGGTSSGGKIHRSGIRRKLASLCWPFSEETNERSGSSSYVARGLQFNSNMRGKWATQAKDDHAFMDVSYTHPEEGFTVVPDGTSMQVDSQMDLDSLGLFSLANWPDVIYDVSAREISFHIPLHRVLSLLLRELMKKCYSKSLIPSSGLHINFFEHTLQGSHPFGFSAFMMEHPLRLRVVVAQVHAGMWRKNGDAADMCCEGYRSVRWFEQGLESDLFLLQCCAALAPPDLYVKRIQERFGLSNYLSLSLAVHDEYEPVLVQEMLTLLIQIVKERRFCGLSITENLQRELIYRLAIGDAPHSQLTKSLPRDLSKSDELQKVLDTIAVYSNPCGIKQGTYSLRKSYWKELDLYHPRWNSRELQMAEERYLRLFKISPQISQLPPWTKVFPPLYPICRIATSKAVFMIVCAVVFYATFTGKASVSRAPEGVLLTALHLLSLALDICDKQKHTHFKQFGGSTDFSNSDNQSCGRTSGHSENDCPLLFYACKEIDSGATNQSDAWKHQSLLSLLVLLLRRYKKENDHDYIDARQSNISSLIESLLQKFAELDTHCKTALCKLVPDLIGHVPQQPSHNTMQRSIVASDAEQRKAKIRERQAAILEKMKAEQSKFLASVKSSAENELGSLKFEHDVSTSNVDQTLEESSPVVCSLCHDPDPRIPVSFMILLQKSRLTSLVERVVPSWEEICQPNVASVKMEGITHNSSVELRNAEINSASHSIVSELSHKSQLEGTNSMSSVEMIEKALYGTIDEYLHDPSNIVENTMIPVVSLAEDSSGKSNDAVFAALVEYFGLLKKSSNNLQASMCGAVFIDKPSSLKESKAPLASADRYHLKDYDGIHISTCGHVVHQECHNTYLATMRQRYNRRPGEGARIVDPHQGEFLCPVCRRFGNSILPLLPGDIDMRKQIMPSDGSSTMMARYSTSPDSDNYVCLIPRALALLQKTANMVGQSSIPIFSRKLNDRSNPALDPVFWKLCSMYFPEASNNFLESGLLSRSFFLWDMLQYTISSTEISVRGKRINTHSEGSNPALEALYREIQSSNGFILSFLLQIVQKCRSMNTLEAHLRFRGVQLFAGSICSGVSLDDYAMDLDTQRGIMPYVVKIKDKGDVVPHLQFYKQAADPILAHDPFSSLMWVLFCLPSPFLSSMGSFMSLVHLFHVVCVAQALILYHGKHHFGASELGLSDCALNDICRTLGESELAKQFFVSNHIDTSCNPKDLIRRVTFPYLRRCALLWKLLTSSISVPFYDNYHVWDKVRPYTNNDALDSTSELSIELGGVRELEHMFQISLDLVLKNELVHTLALKWCQHFQLVSGDRNYGRLLHCNPAVPFKLLHLPHIYQPLLQRYIKQQCPNCKEILDEPALCLLCGKLCSPNWKLCCSENECQKHAMVCGAGIGIFLIIRRTTILLLRNFRQATWLSPYLDAFGEEDIEMKRGKPLYLSEERYAALTHMVASHGLDSSSAIFNRPAVPFLDFDD